FFRVTLAQKHFAPGPFNLGRYGIIVGWATVVWAVIISVLFSLPFLYSIVIQTFNFAPVAVGSVLAHVVVFWKLTGHRWFKDPLTDIKNSIFSLL
ncbi:hypothetical protein VIGAN_08035800, partial [Vigna angularis var. angularis]